MDMKKNYYSILLILVLVAVGIAIMNIRSNKKNEAKVQEDVARIQKELEPKLTKLMELKSNLKDQANKLKEDMKGLHHEAKKEVKGQKDQVKEKMHEVKSKAGATKEEMKSKAGAMKEEIKAKTHENKEEAKEKVHNLKEEAQKKRDILKEKIGATKDEAIQKTIEEYENMAKDLEDLEIEMDLWKEEVAKNLRDKKAQATKEGKAKLAEARDKLQAINDRMGKAIEKAGQSMQHHE